MFEILKILHLLAFGAGLGVSISNSVLGPRLARASGPARGALAALMPVFGMIGTGAIVVLWITGVWMIADRYGGSWNLGAAFSWKLALVVALTADILVLQYYSITSRRKGVPPPAFVRLLGMGAGLLLLGVVISAGIAFN